MGQIDLAPGAVGAVGDGIGREIIDGPVEDRRGALVEPGQAHGGFLADMDVVYTGARDQHLDDQRRVRGQDLDDRTAGFHDPARGMIVKTHDGARHGRDHIGPVQDVLGLALLFAHAFQFAFDGLQLCQRVAAVVVAGLGYLRVELGAHLGQFGDFRLKASDLPIRLEHGAAQGQRLAAPGQAAFDQLGLGLKLLGQKGKLALGRVKLDAIAGGADVQGFKVARDDADIIGKAGAGGLKGQRLPVKDHRGLRVVPLCLEMRGENQLVQMLLFGHQPGLRRLETDPPQGQFARGRQGKGLVQSQHDLTFGDAVALLDQNVRDDAAFQMLDDLVLARGHETALRDHGGGQRGHHRPCAETAEGHQHQHKAEGGLLADRAWHVLIPGVGAGDDGQIRHGWVFLTTGRIATGGRCLRGLCRGPVPPGQRRGSTGPSPCRAVRTGPRRHWPAA